MEAIGELLEGVQAGGVEGSHIAQAEDHNTGKSDEVFGSFLEFLRCSEEKRSVNTEDGDIGRDFFVLQDMRLAIAEVVGCDGFDGGGFGNAIDVEQGGESHADADGNGKIGNDSEGEGDGPDGDVSFGHAEDAADFAPFAHVPRNDEEYRGEG